MTTTTRRRSRPTLTASARATPSSLPGRSAYHLLTTEQFGPELLRRLAGARRQIDLQLMTFDGDRAGLAVADALQAAAGRGVPVRLLIDCFSHRFVSDQPVGRRAVAAEHRRTRAMYAELAAAGVRLRFTHPNGPANLFALARNHKKLYLIDGVAYLGGINVSDHNFAWHDFMVRVDDPDVGRAVAADFDASFAGRRRTVDGAIVTNRALARTFDELVAGARHRVVVASPYAVDRRLAEVLEASPAPSRTVVVAPENNFWCLQLIAPYLFHRLERAGVGLLRFPRFSHAKFLLVDNDALLVGSSNFGRHSLSCNDEIGVVIRDRGFIAAFEQEMLSGLEPVEPVPDRRRRLAGRVGAAVIDRSLMVYARTIAPLVPALAPDP